MTFTFFLRYALLDLDLRRKFDPKNLISVFIGTYQSPTIFDTPKKRQNHSTLPCIHYLCVGGGEGQSDRRWQYGNRTPQTLLSKKGITMLHTGVNNTYTTVLVKNNIVTHCLYITEQSRSE